MKYIAGHQTRVRVREGRFKKPKPPYVPRPDEIPSGLCECGCGNETTIAKATEVGRRWFRGHPKPYYPGHHSRRWNKGKDAVAYKGGKFTTQQGYVLVLAPEHPAQISKGYVWEHRLVMEEHLGRYLLPKETVHHRNGIKDDNRIENLELWSKKHSNGRRVTDLQAFAREIRDLYGLGD